MKFRTTVQPVNPPFRFSDKTRFFTIGSCFTEHIGRFLKEHFFRVSINPFGTMFNPFSIAQLLNRVRHNEIFTGKELVFSEGLYKHFDLHSVFNKPGQESFLENANHVLYQVKNALQKTDVLIITYGTAQVFKLKDNKRIVANCHKFPGHLFDRQLLEIEDIYRKTQEIYHIGLQFNPDMHFIFSISPVRYLQDGMPANSRSKARLTEAVQEFTSQHPENTYYFPAYEIFMDDLRDYRFYDIDLIHPGEQGIRYVTEIFENLFFDEKGKEMLRELEKFRKMIHHKPFYAGLGTLEKFREKIKHTRKTLQKKYLGLALPDLKEM